MRKTILVSVILCCLFVIASANAQVTVIREGYENPTVTIAKSTFWGGLIGLMLGGAVALVKEDHEEDIIKWSFVAGTFGGFGLGIYHTATRERPYTSLLNTDLKGVVESTSTLGASPFTNRHKSRLLYKLKLFSFHF